MSHHVEVFENEEASKLLDYVVAYKKLMSNVEHFKRISALNNEVHFKQTSTQTENDSDSLIENQPATGLTVEFTK